MMHVQQFQWRADTGWSPSEPQSASHAPGLVLSFAGPSTLTPDGPLDAIVKAFPKALHFGCSTAGEIAGARVSEDSLVATAVAFESTTVKAAHATIGRPEDSYEVGRDLAAAIPAAGLRHAFVLSDGLSVNGSELVRGLRCHLPTDVTVTGGLSADGPNFKRTCVIWEGRAHSNIAAILGFYGPQLQVGFGSLGGWDPFGPERLITRSEGNVVYEFDGQSALGLYKRYLGEHAAGLPATGLLFPLSLRTTSGEVGVVRTILGVDEDRRSMTFAGDMPEGAYARLMKANFDRLIDGAVGAARATLLTAKDTPAELAVLISCVGRKLVLAQRTEEEVEGVREVLGPGTPLTGFYSYGEISPFTPGAKCELHNQTMTITTFAER